MASKQRNTETYKLMLLGVGQMFGDDDLVFERPHSSTLICRSNIGIVYCMRASEFFKKLRGNDDCWKAILRQVKSKEKETVARMRKLNQIFHEEIKDKTKNESLPSNMGGSESLSQEKPKLVSQYPNIMKKYNLKVT